VRGEGEGKVKGKGKGPRFKDHGGPRTKAS
jgi:hypothetical protein